MELRAVNLMSLCIFHPSMQRVGDSKHDGLIVGLKITGERGVAWW